MKTKVFVDEDYKVYNQDEVDNFVREVIENSEMDMVRYFMKDINTRDDLNPLFCALYNGDSEAFQTISEQFQRFLDCYKKDYIEENFHESYVEV